MADVASKPQTTALFLSTIVTRTRRHTDLTNLMGNLCCAREHSVQFFVQFFTQLNCTVNLRCMGPFRVHGALKVVWGPLGCMGPFRLYGAIKCVWALKGVWGPLWFMGPFMVYEAL